MLSTILEGRTLLRVEEDDSRAVGLAALLLVLFLVTVGVFVFASSYVAVPLLALLAVATVGWATYQATTARMLTLSTAIVTVLTIGFIIIFLFLAALPMFRGHLVQLFTSATWAPGRGIYGLLAPMWSTLLTTIIATLIAAPLGVLAALFISEIAPGWVREIVKPGIEILAGIPSIVYGYIGFVTLNNYVRVELLDKVIGSYFIAGIVIGVMALPTVVSVSEDALASVPESMKSGSLAMGTTRWQTMKSISVPAAFSGISAGVILGIGRAVGETMAVAMIMGGGVGLPKSTPIFDLFAESASLTSLIATQYGNASETTLEALFAAGVVLFLVVATMSIISQYIERRMERKLEGDA